MQDNARHRNSIYSQAARVVSHYAYEADQYVLTLESPDIANMTKPGQFVHIQCSDELLMRRPISIMSVDTSLGYITLLYKAVGIGTKLLAKAVIDKKLAIIGPIGNDFNLGDKKNLLLLGGGVGMPPMIAIAQSVKGNAKYRPFVILGSEVPFPFNEIASNLGENYAKATHAMPLLEDWGIPSRLTSLQDYQGVYQGYITDLAKVYLDKLSDKGLSQVEIFACGPHPMLKAVAKLAKEYNLPAQVSLEEYMACAIGGCAGCVVQVKQNNKITMKRVCVDGPVFDANTVF